MVEVTVNASWRMSRVEFNTAHNMPATVRGYGEVLLEEAGKPSEDASILRGPYQPFGEVEPDKKTYGTMPGATITRAIADVLTDTIEVDGKTTTFASVVDSLKRFMEKWRVEDAEKPQSFTVIGKPLPMPPAVPLTPMPPESPAEDPRANG
jgi:hypothetical protein